MRDLQEIKRINSAKGVGDKLGAHSGHPWPLSDRASYSRAAVRGFLANMKGPSALIREPLSYIVEAVDEAIAEEAR